METLTCHLNRLWTAVVAVILASCISNQIHAQTTGVPCLYEDVVSVVSVDMNIDRFCISGEMAYALFSNYGIGIYDYSTPSTPELLFSMEVAGNGVRSVPEDIEIDGDVLYVAESGYGLHAFDVSNPTSPTQLSVLLLDGVVHDVEIRDDTAFVTSNRPDAFYTIDISDPSAMSVIGTLDEPCRDVSLAGNYAYLAAHGAGVHIVDISNLSNPVLISSLDFPVSIPRVAISGTTLVAIGSGTAESYTVDVSNPASPQIVGQFSDYDFARDIVFHGGLGYVTGRPSLQLLDFTDPSKPELVGAFDTLNDAADVVINANIATVPTSSGAQLYQIDVSDPKSSALLSYSQIYGGLFDIQIVGDYAFIAADVNGLIILDMSDPLNPVEVGSIQTPSDASRLFVDNGYVYLTLEQTELQIVDVTDPTSPIGLGIIDLDAGLYDVCVVGDIAVVTASQGLYLVDVGDKRLPQLRGILEEKSFCSESAPVIYDGYVFWSGCDSGLQTVDITNPEAPVVVNTYGSENLGKIVNQGSTAIVNSGSVGFDVIDLSDPINPALLGQGPASLMYDARLVNGRYYTAGVRGLRMYDLSDPSQIELSGFYEIELGATWSLEVRDEIAHVLSGQGIYAIDVSDCELGCLVDVNGDGSVTPADFTAWINAFNNDLPECDQNSDGSCTPTDFTAWINNYNAGC